MHMHGDTGSFQTVENNPQKKQSFADSLQHLLRENTSRHGSN